MAIESQRKSFFKRIRGLQGAEDAEMSFIDHLEALRWHIVRSVFAVLVFAIAIFLNIDWIFDKVILGPSQDGFISYKLLCALSHKIGMGDSLCMPPIAMKIQVTTVSGTFMSSISIAAVGGILAAFPYLCWEVWRFVKPALKPEELKHTRGIIFWVSFFFFLGAAFGYFMLAPFTFNFLYNYTLGSQQILDYKPMLSDYLDSIIDITLGSGIAFELPMASWLLARIGLLTPGFLRTYRKYAYVALLVLAAIITPSPDWGSQMIVCVPLVLLYEISIIIAARVTKKNDKKWEEWS
ncbi:twin-arginine translocase subunit TatC [Agriterribacter sp.]|uniref:twin-arginine translocase subunit TatC n=1 Tax=Agriterribacter sp. TaxID=2821509 RepID=UPI002B9C552B|nr:twin-arginine translocase subunit TatC [Agriterribacter sp.]HRO45319.1 twin-arginine translocase subunit TatC [Agriterribacter sp.]HRQ17120.1 twin-arginine translocase subunit TatC [Agriterribacter sp.]